MSFFQLPNPEVIDLTLESPVEAEDAIEIPSADTSNLLKQRVYDSRGFNHNMTPYSTYPAEALPGCSKIGNENYSWNVASTSMQSREEERGFTREMLLESQVKVINRELAQLNQEKFQLMALKAEYQHLVSQQSLLLVNQNGEIQQLKMDLNQATVQLQEQRRESVKTESKLLKTYVTALNNFKADCKLVSRQIQEKETMLDNLREENLKIQHEINELRGIVFDSKEFFKALENENMRLNHKILSDQMEFTERSKSDQKMIQQLQSNLKRVEEINRHLVNAKPSDVVIDLSNVCFADTTDDNDPSTSTRLQFWNGN